MDSKAFGSEVDVGKGQKTRQEQNFFVRLGGGTVLNEDVKTEMSTGIGSDRVVTRSQGLGEPAALSGSPKPADQERIDQHMKKNNAIAPCFPMS
jgi:hypothetical protein